MHLYVLQFCRKLVYTLRRRFAQSFQFKPLFRDLIAAPGFTRVKFGLQILQAFLWEDLSAGRADCLICRKLLIMVIDRTFSELVEFLLKALFQRDIRLVVSLKLHLLFFCAADTFSERFRLSGDRRATGRAVFYVCCLRFGGFGFLLGQSSYGLPLHPR